MDAKQHGYGALGRLADEMTLDIVSTPADVFLAQVAEDHGSADALSARVRQNHRPGVAQILWRVANACPA